MRRLTGALVLAVILGACGTPQVTTSPTASLAPTIAPTSTPTIAPTAAATAAPTTQATPAPAATTTAPSTGAATPSPTAALAASTSTPTPRALASTPSPTASAASPTIAPTASPSTTPSGPRPTVYIVHSADNYMHVQFDSAMAQSGPGAANVLSSYQLDGAPLPAGSTIMCGSPSCDVVRIDMPGNLPRGSAHYVRVAGVVGANGMPLDPDPTLTPFRTDLQSETP